MSVSIPIHHRYRGTNSHQHDDDAVGSSRFSSWAARSFWSATIVGPEINCHVNRGAPWPAPTHLPSLRPLQWTSVVYREDLWEATEISELAEHGRVLRSSSASPKFILRSSPQTWQRRHTCPQSSTTWLRSRIR
jgi:hypothetical protein